MNRRNTTLVLLVLVFVVVFTGVAMMLAATRTVFADGWSLVMFAATEPFSIGTDVQKYLQSFVWAEPPLDFIKEKTIKLYWAEDEESEPQELTSGTIANKVYYLIVEITLKEGHSFNSSGVSLEFHNNPDSMELFEEISPLVPDGTRRVRGILGASLVDYCIVRFDANGGSPKLLIKSVEMNGKITAPKIPLREGYKFDGWWTDAEGGDSFDFSKPLKNDVTIYAHWVSLTPDTTPPTTTDETTVEETSTWMSGPDTTSDPGMNAVITTALIDSDADSDKGQLSLIVIAAIVVAASLLGGGAGYFIYTRKEKNRDE